MVTRGPRFSASRQPTIRTCCSWMAALRPRTIHGSEPYSFRKGGSFRVFVQPCVKSRRKECPSAPGGSSGEDVRRLPVRPSQCCALHFVLLWAFTSSPAFSALSFPEARRRLWSGLGSAIWSPPASPALPVAASRSSTEALEATSDRIEGDCHRQHHVSCRRAIHLRPAIADDIPAPPLRGWVPAPGRRRSLRRHPGR